MARRQTTMGRTTIEGTPVDGAADGFVVGSSDGAEDASAGTDRTGMEDPYEAYALTKEQSPHANSRKRGSTSKKAAPALASSKRPSPAVSPVSQGNEPAQARSELGIAKPTSKRRPRMPEGYILNSKGRLVNATRSLATLTPEDAEQAMRRAKREWAKRDPARLHQAIENLDNRQALRVALKQGKLPEGYTQGKRRQIVNAKRSEASRKADERRSAEFYSSRPRHAMPSWAKFRNSPRLTSLPFRFIRFHNRLTWWRILLAVAVLELSNRILDRVGETPAFGFQNILFPMVALLNILLIMLLFIILVKMSICFAKLSSAWADNRLF